MSRWSKAGIILFLILILVLLVVPIGCICILGAVGDGAFCQAEYQIKFVTQDGAPVDGVQLEVRNKQGDVSFGYPVNDYHENNIPTSDKNGIIIFHHVFYFMEWGGLIFIPCANSSAPEFNCHFIRNGEVLHSVKYSDLDDKCEADGPTIIRVVSVYDEESALAAWRNDDPDHPVNIIEEELEFTIVELTLVINEPMDNN